MRRQCLEDLLTLYPRQGRSQAVMNSRSEGYMLVRPPGDADRFLRAFGNLD
jgi:hypothetical protein